MYRLTDALLFPSPEQASAEGIVAVGGDLQPERVMLAYRKGIFPWFESDDFLLWWSPDPRMVLFPDNLKIAIPDGPRPVDSANIFIYFFSFFP